MKARSQECTKRAEIAERGHDALQQEYDRVAVELVTCEGVVDELERRVEEVEATGHNEVEKCQQVIEDLKSKLQQSQEKFQASQEQVKGRHMFLLLTTITVFAGWQHRGCAGCNASKAWSTLRAAVSS